MIVGEQGVGLLLPDASHDPAGQSIWEPNLVGRRG